MGQNFFDIQHTVASVRELEVRGPGETPVTIQGILVQLRNHRGLQSDPLSV